jgi:ABC-type transporter Mla subunit MlaD
MQTRTFEVRGDPARPLTEAARQDLDEILSLQAALVGAAAVSRSAIGTLATQAAAVTEALADRDPEPSGLVEQAHRFSATLEELRTTLQGPGQGGVAQQETVLPLASLVSRLYSSTESWTGKPTNDQRRLTSQAHRAMAELLDALRALVTDDLPALRRAVTEAGFDWPAGDPPTIPENLIPRYES